MSELNKSRILAALGRILLVIGLASLAAGIYFAGAEWRGPHSATAQGKVVAVGNLPAIEFTMADGSIIRSINTARASSWHVGDSVVVAYNPANPSDAVPDGLWGRWFQAALAGLVGAVLVFAGLAFRLAARRR